MWLFGKWITVLDTGKHLYQQHTRTNKRRILRYNVCGYQPIDTQWIETGEFYKPQPPSM